jgi:hypothetical protein
MSWLGRGKVIYYVGIIRCLMVNLPLLTIPFIIISVVSHYRHRSGDRDSVLTGKHVCYMQACIYLPYSNILGTCKAGKSRCASYVYIIKGAPRVVHTRCWSDASYIDVLSHESTLMYFQREENQQGPLMIRPGIEPGLSSSV